MSSREWSKLMLMCHYYCVNVARERHVPHVGGDQCVSSGAMKACVFGGGLVLVAVAARGGDTTTPLPFDDLFRCRVVVVRGIGTTLGSGLGTRRTSPVLGRSAKTGRWSETIRLAAARHTLAAFNDAASVPRDEGK